MGAEQESHDRYLGIARLLRVVGGLQDALLRPARRRAVEILRADGAVRVLDACCGTGTLAHYLSQAGMDVMGVDASASMLELARRKAPAVNFVLDDVSRLQLDAPVDGAVIALALHEMPEPVRVDVWQALRRSVKPASPVVVIDYAVLDSPNLLRKVAAKVIAEDERYVGKLDPGHYENFLDFQARGGTRGWLESHGETVASDTRFLFGNLSVAVVRP